MSRCINLLLLLCCWGITVHAQKIKKEDYFFIDKLVQDAGPMEGSSLQYIVDSITKQCKTELQATRAFYRWATFYLSYDMKRHRHPANAPDNASTALMERKAAASGYAQIFKAMCDLKKIPCVVVKGVVRRKPEDIGKFDADELHYWNMVTIDNTRYFIDPAWGAGYLDRKGKHFTKEYTDAWWLCNRKAFAYMHFPDDKQLQGLEVPVSRTEFSQAPLVLAGAIVAGIIPTSAVKGMIRGAEDTSTKYRFNIAGHLDVTQVSISYDQSPLVPALVDFDEFGFYITIPHGPSGSHVAEVYIKGKTAFVFRTEIRKSNRKKKW